MYAAFHNHPNVADALIDAKCDIDATGTVSLRNEFYLIH